MMVSSKTREKKKGKKKRTKKKKKKKDAFIDFFRTESRFILQSEEFLVFLVETKNTFILAKRVLSVNTHSRISTVPRGSERSE